MGWLDRLFEQKEPKGKILIRACITSLQITKQRPYGYGSIKIDKATVTITFGGRHKTTIAGISGSNCYPDSGMVTLDIVTCDTIKRRIGNLEPRLNLSPRSGLRIWVEGTIETALEDTAIRRFGRNLKEGETATVKPRGACAEWVYEVKE